ncbi:MAG: CDP-diacylglycerol--glycerol-3-phosphate 3-phosphatidyltransferase [Treponema sp.]|nr:CDP-diacylglycerol--glycerol-3-phosphate 3-phosphatidyltransferase [Spirochaetia bacterium]MDD7460540.1 CDP-diacylglycerol--glycerol-3-phosphate 3-phosphatidyltransferase [Spirochaetales bacterium]MDY5812086.1 CDP-diacylglycerol--glycerol-3-phosphate 3-phosphatidyltransferase [Treponema sp.]
MKVSNKFTMARVISSPILFLIYFIPIWTKAAPGSFLNIASVVLSIPLLAATELTDYFDGHYARLHGEVSDFGKMFDPFADVFLHLSMFTCFVFSGYMPVCFYIPILYREFSQNFLRMVAAKSGTAIAARKGGKVKTVFYVASCFVALVQESLVRTGLVEIPGITDFAMDIFRYIGYGFFGVCVVLAYTSFIDYLKNFGKILKENI